MSDTKRPVGRPTKYTPALAEYICEQIAQGKSLRQICAGEAMPADRTVYRWLGECCGFRQQYAHARERQADRFADEIIEIADAAEAESGAVQKARLQIDARKWAASKLHPKKYGDKTEVSGSVAVGQSAADLTDGELAAELAKYGIKP